MDNYFNGVVGVFKIQNKADAMQYAINTTMIQNGCGVSIRVDYAEAERLFNFICEHVEFPEDPTKKVVDELMPMINALLQSQSHEPNMPNY